MGGSDAVWERGSSAQSQAYVRVLSYRIHSGVDGD